ncbi:GMC family oxidoreductase [soil metagenome]
MPLASIQNNEQLANAHETRRDQDSFAVRAAANQLRQAETISVKYDYIVCGSGSSGSVVARRLAEDENVKVLLLEAGGSDDVPSVSEATNWFSNLGTERDWGFVADPNPNLNGRAMPLSMGKVLGGGSSINAMIWSRGHRNDWDFFSSETRDSSWSYESVLKIYRKIEDWHGEPDPSRRGEGGLLYIAPSPDPNPLVPAVLCSAADTGIPYYKDQNGTMMEGAGGASLTNLRIRDSSRQSIFRSYVYPLLEQTNLTVLTYATVVRIVLQGKRALGVEAIVRGERKRFEANVETILSLGAINTPKLLMQSGIGDERQLNVHGIPCIQNLPGVGQNFQDHFLIAGCVWEYKRPQQSRSNGIEATIFWKSDSALDTPDLQPCLIEMPIATPETGARFNPPAASWTLAPGVVRPKSRGEVTLTGPKPDDPIRVRPNTLSHPDDLVAAVRGVALCREIGNNCILSEFRHREVMPGNLAGVALDSFVRDSIVAYWHQSGTAKMGLDGMSVVDPHLRVYGIDNLRIADASVMPRVTTGNTMAPCVVIGERLSALLKAGQN